MAIRGENGNELGEVERGEIVIRDVNVMLEYYNKWQAHEKTFKNGWFRSGNEVFYVRDEEERTYFYYWSA